LEASGAHCVKVVEDVVIKKFTFTISSPDEFPVILKPSCNSELNAEYYYSYLLAATNEILQQLINN